MNVPRPSLLCSNTDLDGWPRSTAGVLRAAGETQGWVYCPLAGWLCCGRVARGWHPQGPGSCRRGHRLGHRGHSAGPRARGHIHSLVGSGPRPHARLQSGPRCTAERRPLSGRRESRSWAQLLVAKAWWSPPGSLPQGEGEPSGTGTLGVLGGTPVPSTGPAPLYPQTIGTTDRATTLTALLFPKCPLLR